MKTNPFAIALYAMLVLVCLPFLLPMVMLQV